MPSNCQTQILEQLMESLSIVYHTKSQLKACHAAQSPLRHSVVPCPTTTTDSHDHCPYSCSATYPYMSVVADCICIFKSPARLVSEAKICNRRLLRKARPAAPAPPYPSAKEDTCTHFLNNAMSRTRCQYMHSKKRSSQPASLPWHRTQK